MRWRYEQRWGGSSRRQADELSKRACRPHAVEMRESPQEHVAGPVAARNEDANRVRGAFARRGHDPSPQASFAQRGPRQPAALTYQALEHRSTTSRLHRLESPCLPRDLPRTRMRPRQVRQRFGGRRASRAPTGQGELPPKSSTRAAARPCGPMHRQRRCHGECM